MPEPPYPDSSRAADPVVARIGTVLSGKWTLERLLGSGGMAAVYVGRHKIGRRDAIKILHTDIDRDSEVVARFEQEAHAVNCLHHPGVVQIHDIGTTEDGAPYLVMELLQGQSLADRIDAGRLELPEALRIIDELLDVLAAAHAAQVIHRDIKPDNLFLLDDGRLKVLDFGIARVRRAGSTKVVTKLGATLGTPSYMPQEQILGMDLDHRADLFAVGAVLFELLTGRRVHEGDNEQMVMVKMLTCPAPPIATIAPELPLGLCAVVDRALGFSADDRYPDAVTMQADVQAVRDGDPPPYASSATSSAERSPSAQHPPAQIAGAGAVAVGSLGAATGGGSPNPPAATLAQPPAGLATATVTASDTELGVAPAQTLTPASRGTTEPGSSLRAQKRLPPALILGIAALGLATGVVIVLWAASGGDDGETQSAHDGATTPFRLDAVGGSDPNAPASSDASEPAAMAPTRLTSASDFGHQQDEVRKQEARDQQQQPPQPDKEQERKKRQEDKERERKKGQGKKGRRRH